MEMSKFLMIASDYKPLPGGTAEYLDTLARGLMNLGDTIKVLAVVKPEEKVRRQFLESYEPWVIPFLMQVDPKPKNTLGRKVVSVLEMLRCSDRTCRRLLASRSVFKSSADSVKRLQTILSEEKPETIIFGHLDINLYPLALCILDSKLPYVVIAHDSEILQVSRRRNGALLRKTMLRGSTWIAANSRYTKALTEVWRIPSDQVKVVCPPISQEVIDESAVLESKPRDDGGFTVVTICRLVKGKGIDLVLHALKILEARGIQYQYMIGGDGPERESLEAMVDALELRGKVHFEGLVEGQRKWQLLRMGDVFVTPSRFDPTLPWREGFGIAFIEAAAFGLPAVASKSGGIPEAVVDGETGMLVPEESASGIADALTFLCRNPEIRLKMGTAARERARRQFSSCAIAAQFKEEILNAVHL
jgi:phosphatidylinositol alpha-1,6-mannosyltransferase